MSKIADSIRRGLEEAVSYAEGTADESAYFIHIPAIVDVKSIRTGLGMTQDEFAGRFGFSVNTLRHWEQGSRQPEGAARAYLMVIERAPKAVQEALQAAAIFQGLPDEGAPVRRSATKMRARRVSASLAESARRRPTSAAE